MDEIALRLEIRALVQGVGYRWSMVGEVRRLGIRLVRNRHDRTVGATVVGPPDAVDRILGWARRAPGSSVIDAVDVFEGERAFDSFDARPTEEMDTHRHTLPHRRDCASVVAASLLSTFLAAQSAVAQDFAAERRRMVEDITAVVRETRAEIGKSAFDERVMSVLARVPRHEFVPADQVASAYRNRPLAIGYGQTISQPYIVALMTDLARIEPDHKVLEVGTGSGYQAAVMAHLAKAVYTIEIVEPLGLQAAQRLKTLGYTNVQVRVGDGYNGWDEHAPYDVILVTAAASHIPPPLLRQLKAGGRMVIPVGAAFMVQQLMLVEKNLDGTVSTRQILPVTFVPLTSKR